MAQASLFGASWQGTLADLAVMVEQIKRTRAFGRLSVRNLDQAGIVHLYFKAGALVHIIAHRGDVHAVLRDLQSWRRASVRFDRGVTAAEVTLGEEHEHLLDSVLAHLCRLGIAATPQYKPQLPRVVEGGVVVASEAKQLIAPWEWRVLVEGTRRVSLAVAHLVGPREAYDVLQDILADCSATFPAFASLTIASTGYLQVSDRMQLDRMSRDDLLQGFTALIAICQHFCAPIIGERDAHQLIIQALQDLGPTLINLGVFRIDPRLISNSH